MYISQPFHFKIKFIKIIECATFSKYFICATFSKYFILYKIVLHLLNSMSFDTNCARPPQKLNERMHLQRLKYQRGKREE